MTHEVALTADAAADLLQIADWIAENDSAANALHVLERIEAVVRGLARFPQRGAYPSELLALGIRDFRETAFKPYRVIYRVEGRKVLVYLIADGRRDLQTLLSRRLLAPVEIYSAERIREFDAAEADLDKLLRGKKKPRR